MIEPAVKIRRALHFSGTYTESDFQSHCAKVSYWYHSFYFDNGWAQPGIYDIGRDIETYDFPRDMTGWNVLDVGPGSGWFTVFFEQRGAHVCAADVRDFSDYDEIGNWKQMQNVISLTAKPVLSHAGEAWMLMKELLGLRAVLVNARVYDISPLRFPIREFDLVFAGAILMHLRDPVGALMALRSVTKRSLIVTMYVDTNPKRQGLPAMNFSGWSNILWWVPNFECVTHLFKSAGFRSISRIHPVRLSCDRPFVDQNGVSHGKDQELYLIEAHV